MPLADHGGDPPSGDAWSFEAALQAFKAAFTEWHAGIDSATRQRNRRRAMDEARSYANLSDAIRGLGSNSCRKSMNDERS